MLMDEIHRALKPNGTVVLSAPFCYQEHGAPHDFRRFSVHGSSSYWVTDSSLSELTAAGGIGSTLGTLYLHYVQESMNRNTLCASSFPDSHFPFGFLMCAVTNVLGLALDHVDSTESFYGNVLSSPEKRRRVEPPAVRAEDSRSPQISDSHRSALRTVFMKNLVNKFITYSFGNVLQSAFSLLLLPLYLPVFLPQ